MAAVSDSNIAASQRQEGEAPTSVKSMNKH